MLAQEPHSALRHHSGHHNVKLVKLKKEIDSENSQQSPLRGARVEAPAAKTTIKEELTRVHSFNPSATVVEDRHKNMYLTKEVTSLSRIEQEAQNFLREAHGSRGKGYLDTESPQQIMILERVRSNDSNRPEPLLFGNLNPLECLQSNVQNSRRATPLKLTDMPRDQQQLSLPTRKRKTHTIH